VTQVTDDEIKDGLVCLEDGEVIGRLAAVS
jgi:hypothetical protein